MREWSINKIAVNQQSQKISYCHYERAWTTADKAGIIVEWA